MKESSACKKGVGYSLCMPVTCGDATAAIQGDFLEEVAGTWRNEICTLATHSHFNCFHGPHVMHALEHGLPPLIWEVPLCLGDPAGRLSHSAAPHLRFQKSTHWAAPLSAPPSPKYQHIEI